MERDKREKGRQTDRETEVIFYQKNEFITDISIFFINLFYHELFLYKRIKLISWEILH